MKLTGLLTTAFFLGISGAASADCAYGKAKDTTAQITPIPDPVVVAEAELPVILPFGLEEVKED